jgi:hypothetical protein
MFLEYRNCHISLRGEIGPSEEDCEENFRNDTSNPEE